MAHSLPSVTAIGPVRRAWTPRLNGAGREGHVAITFDDGPDPASTPAFLDSLDSLGWKATFFMLGSMARRAPSLAAEVAAAGHEVAVHGDVHVSHLLRSPGAVRADLELALATVAETTGVTPVWFRPPYGAISAGTALSAKDLALRLVLWSAWGRDWRPAATPRSVIADIEKGLAPGATVLLHDSDCTSAPGSWRSALGALPLLAERLEGLDVGPLCGHGIGGAHLNRL